MSNGLFRQVIAASKKHFGSQTFEHYNNFWICQRCNHKNPARSEGGKTVFFPPACCEVEHCSGTIFKLESDSRKST